jgi:hypothetical protein
VCVFVYIYTCIHTFIYAIHIEALRAQKAQAEGVALKKDETFGETVIRVLGLIVITDFFVVIGLKFSTNKNKTRNKNIARSDCR